MDINLKINNIPVTVKQGSTILDASRKAGIKVPTLCFLKEINEIGACRICVVEVKGARNLATACVFPVSEGMEVFTNTPRVLKARKITLELILSDHDMSCTTCIRSTNCELQSLALEYGCETKWVGEKNNFEKDTSTSYLVRDNNKCILCRRCESICDKIQHVGVIGANGRGFKTRLSCAFDRDLKDVPCVACGQCINVCPVGALTERDDTELVRAAIADPKKIVIVGPAPSVRVGLGEEFGLPLGTDVEGKLATALRMLGFDHVFDVNFAADLTIMEEGTEFIGRVKNGGVLPMLTSCSPGWIKYIETFYPSELDHLSSCKSPQGMFGSTIKTYFAEKMKIDPKNIFVVSIMPCVAKKFEAKREQFNSEIDVSLTTRELARMIKRNGIMFNDLPDSKFDDPLGVSTGAAVIFGVTGGVMEAALRTVVEVLEKKPLKEIDFKAVRGTKGIKEATLDVAGMKVKAVAASGIKNAKIIMDKVKAGNPDGWHFIEIMTCPGGCVNGGGQPIHSGDIRNHYDLREIRGASIYKNDFKNKLRKSHDSPVMTEVYKYFGKPNSEKAHHILHTKYAKKEQYPVVK
jgi:NADP-reducing hydrogenase subunit HndD